MRFVVLSSVALSSLVVASCGPPTEIVRCNLEWICSDNAGISSVASTDVVDHCTDPTDADRSNEIFAFQDAFAADCGNTILNCSDGNQATCEAVCATTAESCEAATVNEIRPLE